MQEIKSIKILSVKMQGFKCFKNETCYDFDDITLIQGSNGVGKSSIADALAFAFTGRNFTGETGLDKLHNSEINAQIQVMVRFVDENGEIHELIRIHKRKITSISFNGINIRQTDLTSMVGDADFFLSMFNPAYCIEILDTEGKEMLKRLLPYVSHEEVIKYLPEPAKSLLKDEVIGSPEAYIKNKRVELRENNENLLYYQGQINQFEKMQAEARQGVEVSRETIALLDNEIEALEQIKGDGQLTQAEEQELEQCYIELDVIQNEQKQVVKAAVNDTQQSMAHKISLFLKSPIVEDIITTASKLGGLHNRSKSIRQALKDLNFGFNCPTCGQEFQNHTQAKAKLEQDYENCVAEGTPVRQVLEEQKLAYFAFKAMIENVITDANETTDAALTDGFEKHEKAHEAVKERIALLEHKKVHGGLSAEQIQKLAELQESKKEHEIRLEQYQTQIDEATIHNHIEWTKKEISRLTELIHSVQLYIGKKNQLVYQMLKLNRVSIILTETTKDGEIKDTFKFAYNGREYKRLSLSEKIKAGMEIAELVKRLSGRNYPTFIDNFESVNAIDNVRPSSQLFFSRVDRINKNAALTVSGKRVVVQKDAIERKAG